MLDVSHHEYKGYPSASSLVTEAKEDTQHQVYSASVNTRHFLREVASPLAKRWIEECTSNHASCRKEARTSTLFCTDHMHTIIDLEGNPSRLLMLANEGESLAEEDLVRLVEPDSSRPPQEYLALSHRWGSKDLVKTTKANYAEMSQRGIRVNDLPQTFKDAVQLTREMGYSHLWIDSLCIVQDDEEDWKHEARRMGLVFSKAVCVIEAVDGDGANSGLVATSLQEGNIENISTRAWVLQEQMMPPRSLRFTCGTVLWECRESDASQRQPEMVAREDNLDSNKLPTHPKDIFTFFRDWRLAPNESLVQIEPGQDNRDQDSAEDEEDELTSDAITRKPEPGKSGTYYDKEKGTTMVVFGTDMPEHQTHIREYIIVKGDDARTGLKALPIHPDDGTEPSGAFMQFVSDLLRPKETYSPFLRAWWQFVPLYTKRHITHDSDKFLAINGITSLAQRWTHLRSTFGLWYHFLEKEMCWYVDPSDAPGHRPMQWIGPSWSWMSTRNGCVKNDIYTTLPRQGSLRLKPEFGMPPGTSFDMPLPLKAWQKPDHHGVELKGNLRKALITSSQDEKGKRYHQIVLSPTSRHSDFEVYDFRPDCVGEFPLGQAVSVYCLHVWHYCAAYSEIPRNIDIYLVLRQVGEPRELQQQKEWTSKEEMLEERTFSRLGYMDVRYKRDEMRSSEEIHKETWWWWLRLV